MRAIEHVLMVDDDQHDIYLTRRAFQKLGWTGEFDAVTGAEQLFEKLGIVDQPDAANDKYNAESPQILLLDLNMPGIDGFEVLRRLREDPRQAQLPVIVLTTSQSQDDIDKAYELGANSYISKPNSPAGMRNLAKLLCHYWFDLVSLPSSSHS